MTDPKQSSVAIIGVSALFPGMSDGEIGAGKFWRDIFHERNLIADVPPHRWRIDDYFDEDPSCPGKTYSNKGAFLGKTPFNPMTYGIPPKVIAATDTSQLLALIVAHQLLEDAALKGVGGINESNRDKMSVILGVTAGQELMNEMAASLERPVWQKSLREMGLPEEAVQEACDRIAAHYTTWEESTFPGLLGNVVAGRIANRFNLGGTNCVTDAACASALSAVHLAVNELLLGESDVVITGGVDTFNDIFMYVCFSKTPALSPTGDCRPFSDSADGTVLGEGLALFALKRTADAIRDNDRIYATIEGVGTSSDGRSKSIYAPVPDGQAKAIRRAYERAGYPFSSVGLVEAHGTGTKAGDLAEFQGLTKAFADENFPDIAKSTQSYASAKIALGSVKSQIGHTKAAAGAAGLFKAVMAIANRVLPATLKADVPNPKLAIDDSPFYLNTYTRPWITRSPRRAGISSFGFGGSNFHVTVQEPPKSNAAKRFRSWDTHLFIFIGDSIDSIKAKLDEASKHADSDFALDLFARQTHNDYAVDSKEESPAPYRLAFTANKATFNERIRQSYQLIEKYPEEYFSHPAGIHWGVPPKIENYSGVGKEEATLERVRPEVAFIFPGQGSQYLNMGADLAMSFDCAADVWDTYATELWEDNDQQRSLADVVFPPPTPDTPKGREENTLNKKRLRATEWAQPALGVTSLAALTILKKIGVKSKHYAGHSFGEVMALCASGSISPQDAIDIARCRGVLMAQAAKNASQPGGMMAVKASSQTVERILNELKSSDVNVDDVVIANQNAPSQVVLSGTIPALKVIENRLSKGGITYTRLDVATAFHSPLVADAVKPFAKFLKSKSFAKPDGYVWSNVTARPYLERRVSMDVPSDEESISREIASQLAKAISEPVRFDEMVRWMLAYRARVFIEVGSQGVLSRLIEQIVADVEKEKDPFNTKEFDIEDFDVDEFNLTEEYKKGTMDRVTVISIDSKGSDGVVQLFASLAKLVQVGVPFDLTQLYSNTKEESTNVGSQTDKIGLEVELSGGNYQKPYPPEDPNKIPPPNTQPTYQKVTQHSEDSSTAVSDPTDGETYTLEENLGPFYAEYADDVIDESSSEALPSPTHFYHDDPYSNTTMADQNHKNNNQIDPSWFAAFQEGQRQLAAAHSAYQDAMAQSHIAFLRAVESTQLSLMTMMSGGATLPIVQPQMPYTPPLAPQPQPVQQPVPQPVASTQFLRNEMVPTQEFQRPRRESAPAENTSWMSSATQNDFFTKTMHEPAESSLFQEDTVEVEQETELSLEKVLLETVAEKTGYPAEMLDMGMKLEADLGIDSIKRVEILSSVTDAYPNLPEVDTGRMAELTTLGQILGYLSEGEKKKPLSRNVTISAPVFLEETHDQEEPESEIVPGKSGDASLVKRWVTLEQEEPIVTEQVREEDSHLTSVHIIPDGFGFSDLVADALRSKGVRVEIVLKGREMPPDADTIVYLKGVQTFYDLDEAIRINDDLFLTAKKVAPWMDDREGRFIVVQNTGGHFGFDCKINELQAASAGAPALLKTARYEWPRARMKAIDIDLPEDADRHQELAEAVADEICRHCDYTDIEVGIDTFHRFTYKVVLEDQPSGNVNPKDEPDECVDIGPNDVILASGGARGVTAECLLELGRRTGAKFILLGRTSLTEESERVAQATTDAEIKKAIILDAKDAGHSIKPDEVGEKARHIHSNREIRANLQRFRDNNIEVKYLSVDVRDVKSISSALVSLPHEWQAITVLVHGAGVLADKRIEEKTIEQFDRVFATKINGFYALLAALDLAQLKAITIFSSAAARSGNRGQADYAMANEVLNKIAISLAHRYPEIQVKSLGWGPWRGGMVDESLVRLFESRGVELIEPADGAAAFANEVLRRSKQVEVYFGEVDFGRFDENEVVAPVVRSSVSEGKIINDFSNIEIKLVDLKDYPWLEDHAVKGDTILPVALATEWLVNFSAPLFRLEFSRENNYQFPAFRIDKLEVLQGMRIPKKEKFLRCLLRGEHSQKGTPLECKISNEEESERPKTHHYKASVIPVDEVVSLGIDPPKHLEEWRNTIYDGEALFHEGIFQVLSAVYNVHEQSIFGHLIDLDYAKECIGEYGPRLMSVDACLQLVLLWIKANMNGIALPMSIEMLTLSNKPWPLRGLKVSATIEHRGTNHAKANAEVTDAEGNSLAVLRGIQSYIY